jgi:hypothetical protein
MCVVIFSEILLEIVWRIWINLIYTYVYSYVCGQLIGRMAELKLLEICMTFIIKIKSPYNLLYCVMLHVGD